MASYEELRHRHAADAAAMLPEMLARIDWPAERIAEHRQAELRRLVKVARDLSPWHRKRLNGVDLDDLDETTLAELPAMTKDDVMEHWDEIVTDDRLRLDDVEAHLESLTSDAYLFDRYHAAATGGSTGRRGVFVYDWDGWATAYLSVIRFEARARQRDPELAAAPPVFAMVASQASSHMGSSLPQTFSNAATVWHRFPVNMPLAEIVAGLNAAQPTVLAGYPSALHPLTHEAEAGRLQITPRRIQPLGEPVLPEIRAALEAAWGVPVVNGWGCSEGGVQCLLRGEPRPAPERGPRDHRTRRRHRPARPDRRVLGQDPPDQPLQPRSPAHPLRGHRPAHAPRRQLPLRLGVPAHRRSLRSP